VQLTPLQKKLLFLVNLGKTIAEMILELHGSDFLVNFELYQLYDKGLIEVREVLEERAEPEEAANPFKRGLELMQARRYADAIVLFQEILAGDPNNFRAHELIEEAEKAICADYYSGALGETQVPYFVISQTALTRHSLTHQEGFVASRINGTWDIKAIVMLSPLREIEILRIIDKLLQLKIIALR
jgi:tetratricopeptide (TPR) repeat protein